MATRLSRFVASLEDFKPATLEPEIEENFDVIDATDTLSGVSRRRPPTQRVASGITELTPGQALAGETPIGTAEPGEIEETGKGLSQVAKALRNPAVLNFLADLGIGFAKGNPSEPGTILGTAAKQNIQSQGISRVAAELLEGKSLDEINTAGLTPQTIIQATQIADRSRRTDIAGRRVDVEEERTDIQRTATEKRLDLQERFQNLRESRFDFFKDEEFPLKKGASEAEIAATEARVAIAEKQLKIRRDLADSLIGFREAQIAVLGSEGEELDPAARARLLEARNELINNLSAHLQRERNQLEIAEEDFERSGGPGLVKVLAAMFPHDPSVQQGILQLTEKDSELEAIMNQQRKLVEDLQEELKKIASFTVRDLTTGESATGDSGEGGETETEVSEEALPGTLDNPLQVKTPEAALVLEPGTIFQTDKGIFEKLEGEGFRPIRRKTE